MGANTGFGVFHTPIDYVEEGLFGAGQLLLGRDFLHGRDVLGADGYRGVVRLVSLGLLHAHIG